MTQTASAEALPGSAPAPLPAPTPKVRFWTKRRVIVAVASVLVALLALCGCAALTVWRFVSSETAQMAAMRPFIDQGYPDYRIVDSTRSGYIVQHSKYEPIRLDVRFEAAGQLAVWEGPPRENLSPEWSTAETFFRHAVGLTPDPRTNMNYDIDGFVDAYAPLRPGPNAVISAVWLEDTDSTGLEKYVVLVARRNRVGKYVEDMWPDHRADFTRNPATGTWSGTAFEPVEIPNPNH